MFVSWDKEYKPHLAASDDETRPVLCGVYVDPKGYLCATNTHMLAVIPATIEDAPKNFQGCIIPAAWIKACLGMQEKKRGLFTVEVVFGEGPGVCSAATRFGHLTGRLIEGKAPNFRKVIPSIPEDCQRAPHLGINPLYLSTLVQALGDPRQARIVQASAEAPIYVGGVSGAFGVLMPLQADPKTVIKAAEQKRLFLGEPTPAVEVPAPKARKAA